MPQSIASEQDRGIIDAVYRYPKLAPVVAEILLQASQTDNTREFLAVAMPRVATATGGDYLALADAQRGRWVVLADSGRPRSLPVELLAEAVDRGRTEADDHWIVVPLTPTSSSARAVLRHADHPKSESDNQSRIALEHLAQLLDRQVNVIDQRRQRIDGNRWRLEVLEAVVEIAQRWNETHQMESLLESMAAAATRLFGADRASIFLWDRDRRTLVGRPALGVENNELRIADNAGVVGRVLRSGEPLRVDAAVEPEAIDRAVDAQLGYQTKTLLCVPIDSASGQRFGVFELVNKLSGGFTEQDEAALVELSAHAAVALENAQDRQRLLATNRQMVDEAAQGVRLVGRSTAIEALRSITRRVADTDLAVLILGENGTGKEVVAQSIHYLSRRRDKPFVAVNCGAIPETLAESELFGHERGAFTDAHDTRQGKFELAAEGTLFLDEIGDLPLGGQAKLLRVLEQRVLVRVGGSTPIPTGARVLAATNQNLTEMVRQKRFREDLYFRLAVVTIEMPPLRDRPEDILLLAESFLDEFCRKARRKTPKFSPSARRRLQSHPWPGNVRELRNLMERIAFLDTSDVIEVDQLAFILSPRGPSASGPAGPTSSELAAATAEFQIRHISEAIARRGGNVSQAATDLGLHRSNLYRKMRQLGMAPPD